VSPPETRRDKINHWLLALENLGGEALAWFDKIFPPETRGDKINHWFHVALPYLIAALVLMLVGRCCGGRGGGRGKTMKAPGRNIRIPRQTFADDPKGYFRNLRARR
ncbi:hypothetical protein Pfo_023876, partial [Paulownia fortunei]